MAAAMLGAPSMVLQVLLTDFESFVISTSRNSPRHCRYASSRVHFPSSSHLISDSSLAPVESCRKSTMRGQSRPAAGRHRAWSSESGGGAPLLAPASSLHPDSSHCRSLAPQWL